MRIMLFSMAGIPHIGGLSTHVINLSLGVKKLGHNVRIVSLKSIPFPLRIILLHIPGMVIPLFGYRTQKVLLRRLYFLYLKILFKLNYKNFDIINCQDPIATLAASRVNKSKPIVLTMHTYIAIEHTLDANILKVGEDLFMRFLSEEKLGVLSADKIVCVDNKIALHVKENIPEKSNSIIVIHNFVDTDRFSPKDECCKLKLKTKFGLRSKDKVVLSTRRLAQKNGVQYVIQAMKYVKNPNAVLICIGEGPQKDFLYDIVKKEKLTEKILFFANIPYDLIHDVYPIADIVVVPSITVNGLQEATSLSALEAMSSGIPVIASNIGGLSEIIQDGETGMLVPEKDPLAIADRINALLSDQELATNLATNARSYIEKEHSFLSAAKHFVKIYKETTDEL